MKPHFRKRYGVWSCITRDSDRSMFGLRAGYGHTPAEAWDEWARQP